MRPLRFATQTFGAASGAEWAERARQLEAMGYGTLAMPDHVIGGVWAPFVALAGAAVATSTLRLGTLVLDNDFRNPLLVAREAATLDVLSNGRVELGIGAGWLDRDYASLGLPFDRGRVRVRRMAEALEVLERLFVEDEVTFEGDFYRLTKATARPKPVQRPRPPFLVAGGGREILSVAARHADIVALIPYLAGQRKLTPESTSLETAREQLGWLREAAGPRFERIELSVFQDVILAGDREAAIRAWAEKAKVDPEVGRVSIYRVIGDLEHVRAHVLRLRRELGISYFCFRGPHVDELAPLVRELAGS